MSREGSQFNGFVDDRFMEEVFPRKMSLPLSNNQVTCIKLVLERRYSNDLTLLREIEQNRK